MELNNATVLVTGASRGLGATLVRDFRAAGAKVIAVARTHDALQALATETGALAHAADLADATARRGLIAAVEAAHGPIDVLVNNAGIDEAGTFWDLSAEELERVVTVNSTAPAELSRAVLPGMISRGRGHIVNVSSLAGVGVFPGIGLYSATKAFLTQFTAALRADLRGLPIGTTVVETGLFKDTAMTESVTAHPPTAAAFRRFHRLQLLAPTSVERISKATVAAVASNRRHVRFPKRSLLFPLITETPRRIVELVVTGLPARVK